jgi:hypothetical protein
VLILTAVAGIALGWPGEATAHPWVLRPITLPRADWALDVGLGIGHIPGPPGEDITGAGLNLEVRGGLTSRLQLGVRTGLRIGADGRATHADEYGRPFETETYGTDGDTVANPEVSLRWAVARGPVAELALDFRLYIPTEGGPFGIMLAAPVQLHLGDSARIDTGIYVPIIFTEPTSSVISFPLHVWFQIADNLFAGPLTGVRIYNPGGYTAVPLGVGLGYEPSRDLQVRFWFLTPNIKGSGPRAYGAGVALEVRF